MEFWQLVVVVVVVLLPFALLTDFWPRRERCDARGRPLPRVWRPVPRPPVADEHDGDHALSARIT
jgi:hypothetical protein